MRFPASQSDGEVDCTIIICTRNRSRELERTLKWFERVTVPAAWKVEMIIADNGSEDNTQQVIENARHCVMDIRRVYEARPGKSRAQNTAMRSASGRVLLFTDDDVEPAPNWIVEMATPLLNGECDAVAGRILLGDELRRDWLERMHEIWLAGFPVLAEETPELVGASMGIRRSVFERIGEFDEELGPGATGFGEETLVWLQMRQAKMRIKPVNKTHVIHHPDESRLLRSSWLAAAARYGETRAFMMHHWEHTRFRCPRLKAGIVRLKLLIRGFLAGRSEPGQEGCPAWEMSYRVELESLARFPLQARRPRLYPKCGLQRIGHRSNGRE
ncbi:MAG: glycosyltransferase family 2 protein [Verrucomicrobiota bacterium]